MMQAATEASAVRQGTTPGTGVSKGQIWAGRVLSGLVVMFLAFDGILKLFKPQVVIDAFNKVGYPLGLVYTIGILLLVCTALYVIPRTAVLGAILVTGYLGGAVSTHVRVGDPLFSHILFPTYLGVLLWGGLYLREMRLRTLIPLRK